MIKRKKGRKVPPLSIASIRNSAKDIRGILRLGNKKIEMVRFIEYLLQGKFKDFSYEIIPENEMGLDEARTYPDKGLIEIREDIYYKATDGDKRAQFTLAHEFGHLVLHARLGNQANFARNRNEHEIYEDSEWQADTFASEFLMPYEEAKKCRNPEEIAEKFGVSDNAAEVRYKKIHQTN